MILPVYLLVGIINIVAKRNNYNIDAEKNPDMDIRVKRHAMQEPRIISDKTQSNSELDTSMLKEHGRNRREINANIRYNYNQLNLPYTNVNSNYGNQNSQNYNSNNYNNNPYNGNFNYDNDMYNPYHNVKINATARNFNDNINHNYPNYNNNGNAMNTENNIIYYNNNGVNTPDNINNNYKPGNINDNYAPDNINNNYTLDNIDTSDYSNNNLNYTSVTTPPNILEGRIFNFGCPKGKKRVGWVCVKG